MALKAYKEETFKAIIRFLEDGSTVEATFRMPRPIDYYSSPDGNQNLERQKFFANIFKSFDKPVAVEIEDNNGNVNTLNIDSLAALQELGIAMDLSDCLQKWFEKQQKKQEEKDKLVKKSKSDGNSTKKATQQAED